MKKIITSTLIILSIFFIGCTSAKNSIPGNYIISEIIGEAETMSVKAVDGVVDSIHINLIIKEDGFYNLILSDITEYYDENEDYNYNKSIFGKWYEKNNEFFLEIEDDYKLKMNYDNSELTLKVTDEDKEKEEVEYIEFKFKKDIKKYN